MKLQNSETQNNLLKDEIQQLKEEIGNLKTENTRLKIENVNLSHNLDRKFERPSVIVQKPPIKIERFVTQTEVIEKGNLELEEKTKKCIELEEQRQFLLRDLQECENTITQLRE